MWTRRRPCLSGHGRRPRPPPAPAARPMPPPPTFDGSPAARCCRLNLGVWTVSDGARAGVRLATGTERQIGRGTACGGTVGVWLFDTCQAGDEQASSAGLPVRGAVWRFEMSWSGGRRSAGEADTLANQPACLLHMPSNSSAPRPPQCAFMPPRCPCCSGNQLLGAALGERRAGESPFCPSRLCCPLICCFLAALSLVCPPQPQVVRRRGGPSNLGSALVHASICLVTPPAPSSLRRPALPHQRSPLPKEGAAVKPPRQRCYYGSTASRRRLRAAGLPL